MNDVLDGLLKKANLPHVRFHDLRHSAASLLIARGVQLVEVSQLLGHSELRVTADLYAHLLQQTAAKAATIMDDVPPSWTTVNTPLVRVVRVVVSSTATPPR